MKNTKKAIFAAFGIEYKAGKIVSPVGEIAPLLIDGNAKLGRGVWTFSTLPETWFTMFRSAARITPSKELALAIAPGVTRRRDFTAFLAQ